MNKKKVLYLVLMNVLIFLVILLMYGLIVSHIFLLSEQMHRIPGAGGHFGTTGVWQSTPTPGIWW